MEELSYETLAQIKAERGLQTTAFLEIMHRPGLPAITTEQDSHILNDLLIYKDPAQVERLTEAVQRGICAQQESGFLVVTFDPAEVPQGSEDLFTNDGAVYRAHMALQIVCPEKYIELYGDQITGPDDYAEFQGLLYKQAMERISPTPKQETRGRKSSAEKEAVPATEQEMEKATAKAAYEIWVEQCQARKSAIRQAKAKLDAARSERKKIVRQWDVHVEELRDAYNAVRDTPTPERP